MFFFEKLSLALELNYQPIDSWKLDYDIPVYSKYTGSKFWGFKGTVMSTEKVLIKDSLRVSKVSWKFWIPAIYNFAVIYPWNLLFS